MNSKIKDPKAAEPSPDSKEPTPEPNALLSGLRVVEGSAFVAAPLGGMALAQLGAEVIRFDPIGGGLDYHRWPVVNTEDTDGEEGASLFWAGLNKGKKSIAIDLGRPEGVAIATQLITAPGDDRGIFLTNFPARGWLDYDRLKAIREDLIMVNITGDHEGKSAVDYTINAAMGFPYATGPDGTDGNNAPINHVLPAWDAICGLWASTGILAAERHRARTQTGQKVTLALSDVALAITGALGIIGEVAINKEDRPRYGNDLYGGFGRDFETKDGPRVMVVGLTGRQWQGLVRATDTNDAVSTLQDTLEIDLSRQGNRFRARDEIAAIIEPWIKSHSLVDVAKAFDDNGVCWGPYQTFRQLVESDPRCSTDNPLFSMVDHPGIGPLLTPASPLSFGAFPHVAVKPAPALGADTDWVLGDVLGMSSGEIGNLHDSGTVA